MRNGQLRYQVYSRAGQLLYTQDEKENKRIDYISLGGRLVAKRSRPLLTASATNTFLHVDQRGTPSVETDSAGVRLDRAIALPYGSPSDSLFREGPGFTGHQTDSATGLIYMQARYYDPWVSDSSPSIQWMSARPMAETSIGTGMPITTPTDLLILTGCKPVPRAAAK